MSDYQKALEAARRIESIGNGGIVRVDPPYIEVRDLAQDALAVARMLLKNHAVSHGEKPK